MGDELEIELQASVYTPSMAPGLWRMNLELRLFGRWWAFMQKEWTGEWTLTEGPMDFNISSVMER